MKKLVLGLCGALAFGLSAGPASAALSHNFVFESPNSGSQANQVYRPISVAGHPDWTARFAYVPSKLQPQMKSDGSCSPAELGLPSWAASFKISNSKTETECWQFVGSNPADKAVQGKSGVTTTLPTQTYAYVLTFSNGQVFDPTAVNSKCDSLSPYARLQASPLYQTSAITNGKVSLGNLQYEDAQSVGEWYKFTKKLPDYAVNLQDTGKVIKIPLTVPSNEGSTQTISGFCNGSIGTVDINWLANQISTNSWSVNQISVVLLWDVFQTESGQCCVLGYHGSWTNSSNQNGTYSVTAMSNAGIFSASGIQDIHATSHEFGELINDPFGGNTTPLWGHVGQVSGCQNNLEVGDPLTGTVYGKAGGGSGITIGGYTYHPQELVYFSWFPEDKAYNKYGADDVFSMSGTFTAYAKVC